MLLFISCFILSVEGAWVVSPVPNRGVYETPIGEGLTVPMNVSEDDMLWKFEWESASYNVTALCETNYTCSSYAEMNETGVYFFNATEDVYGFYSVSPNVTKVGFKNYTFFNESRNVFAVVAPSIGGYVAERQIAANLTEIIDRARTASALLIILGLVSGVILIVLTAIALQYSRRNHMRSYSLTPKHYVETSF